MRQMTQDKIGFSLLLWFFNWCWGIRAVHFFFFHGKYRTHQIEDPVTVSCHHKDLNLSNILTYSRSSSSSSRQILSSKEMSSANGKTFHS